MKRTFFTLIFCLIASGQVFQLRSQTLQVRLNQGAVLEPQGKVINGAGQDQMSFLNYWNVMHPENKPLIYMTYLNLCYATSNWADGLKAILLSDSGKFQVPQIGLSMTFDGTPSGHYEQDVAAGLYDKQITMFIDGLQSLAYPAFIRIGYEFNGTTWNGYQPLTYIQAYIRITNMIRARGVEVATVWDFSMDGAMDFQDYYPGDSYVDWWGINIFSSNQFTDTNAVQFVDSAKFHHKPVMIGETTPRYVGVLAGLTSWDTWFVPFFTFIHTSAEVKAFCYINWNWAIYPQWSNWGDARLQQNAIVGGNFANELDSIEYLNASSERAFRKTFALSDNTAPATPGTLSVLELGYPLILNWKSVTDSSGLSHYIVYKHGVLSDYTLLVPYADTNIAAGDTITYAVSAMDRAGNESQKTPSLKVTIPSTVNKALNGEFNNQLQSWQLSTHAAGDSANMQKDSSSAISTNNSCLVTIVQCDSTAWNIQLWQWLKINAGDKYMITFKAIAASTKTINLEIQDPNPPYGVYLFKEHTLSNAVQTFTDSLSTLVTAEVKLEFCLGSSTVPVWLDSISVMEISPKNTYINNQQIDKPEELTFLNNYPNPFNTSTIIEYKVTEQGYITLKIFDMMGIEVATLVNEQKPIGDYSLEWNASGISSGIYFCRLQNGNNSQIKKIQLIK